MFSEQQVYDRSPCFIRVFSTLSKRPGEIIHPRATRMLCSWTFGEPQGEVAKLGRYRARELFPLVTVTLVRTTGGRSFRLKAPPAQMVPNLVQEMRLGNRPLLPAQAVGNSTGESGKPRRCQQSSHAAVSSDSSFPTFPRDTPTRGGTAVLTFHLPGGRPEP